MWTQVVLLFILTIFTVSSNALYFPDGSHNRPHFPATGGSVTLDPPSRIVRRQTTPSSTLQPTLSVNMTDWADQINQLCIDAINVTSITNPAAMVPCYNVLSYDPNTGIFLSEVRLFQIVSMEQTNIMSSVTSSGVLLEFPNAEITSSPGIQTITNLLGKRAARLLRRQASSAQATLVDAFYMNGTADVTQRAISAQKLLTPTTATLNLNVSGTPTPFSMSDSMVMFVNGLFSPEFVQSNTTSTTAAAITPSGFVLPGCSFGITPIGFYMFSAYWAVFTAILLIGGFQKRKYRDAFRRRRAAVLNFTAVKRVQY